MKHGYMNLKKDIMVLTLVLSIFVFILASSALYVQTQISAGNACGCLIPLPLFIPFLGSIGLFIGVVIYSILFPSEKAPKLPSKPLLKLFDKEERNILKLIISNNGEHLQAD